jgi:hypothetical protein
VAAGGYPQLDDSPGAGDHHQEHTEDGGQKQRDRQR